MLITHIYPVFCKLMAEKDPNERLTQKLYVMYKEIATPQTKDFYEMNQHETQRIFFNHQERVQNELNKEIKNIFNNKIHIILQKENETKFIKITSNNYTYTFVSDSHNVAILTDFYPTTQKNIQNLLQSSGQKFSINNKNYYITNTYNAFCNFARYIQKTDKPKLTGNLNTPFFHSAKSELENKTNSIKFKYVKLNNFIILYEFKPKVYKAIPIPVEIIQPPF